MPEKDIFTEQEAKDFVCLPEVCKGFCCENISKEVAENLAKLGIPIEPNDDGEFRCFLHDKETGKCTEYEKRCWYCKAFFCPSASRGFMAKVKKDMEEPKKEVKIQFFHKVCGGRIYHSINRPLEKPIKRKYQDVCEKCGKRWDYADEQEPDVEVREVLV